MNLKYSGEKGISPIDSKEYYVFNDLSNPDFKHYVEITTNYLSHSIMDFCHESQSHPLCKDGRSDRYDVHEYLYTVEPINKD